MTSDFSISPLKRVKRVHLAVLLHLISWLTTNASPNLRPWPLLRIAYLPNSVYLSCLVDKAFKIRFSRDVISLLLCQKVYDRDSFIYPRSNGDMVVVAKQGMYQWSGSKLLFSDAAGFVDCSRRNAPSRSVRSPENRFIQRRLKSPV